MLITIGVHIQQLSVGPTICFDYTASSMGLRDLSHKPKSILYLIAIVACISRNLLMVHLFFPDKYSTVTSILNWPLKDNFNLSRFSCFEKGTLILS